MSVSSLKSIGAYALVLVGVAAVVVLSALAFHPLRVNGASPHLTAESPGKASLERSSLTAVSSCSGFAAPSSSTADLRQAQVHAREFLDQQNPSEALTRFRSVAAVDPGLPGIHLDLSTTLLKLRQTESAKSAINTQISISECLARLSPAGIDAYCKAQMPEASASGCRQELASIERSAHFQAALVQMALANSLGGANAASRNAPALYAAEPATATFPAQPRSVARLVAAARATDKVAKPRTAPAKPASHNLLAGGEGTDAALGAYSK